MLFKLKSTSYLTSLKSLTTFSRFPVPATPLNRKSAKVAVNRQIGLADSNFAQIHRAISSIRIRYAETLRIDELAEAAGMSAATFYRHFRAVTAVSPLQYQKKIRLLEARARLIANPQSVAAIGFDVGYESASQFSREYSRLFGTPPAKDLERLRGHARPEQGSA